MRSSPAASEAEVRCTNRATTIMGSSKLTNELLRKTSNPAAITLFSNFLAE